MSEKRALVTGASEGIGQAFAEALATEGYQVTLVARSQERLQAARARLSGAGHEVLVADLSTPAGIERVAAELAGGYTLLINNAGVGSHGAFAATDLLQLQAMMRLNCDAVMQLSHAFLRGSKKGDALINVASVLGLLGMPQVAGLYAATKAFVITFSAIGRRALALASVVTMASAATSELTRLAISRRWWPALPPNRRLLRGVAGMAGFPQKV